MKIISLLLASCAVGICAGFDTPAPRYSYKASIEAPTSQAVKPKDKIPAAVQAGDYLSGRFAQQHHDWNSANAFIGSLLNTGVADAQVMRRAMILAMGSGNSETAVKFAEELLKQKDQEQNSVAAVFLIMDAFDRNDAARAEELLKQIPSDAMAQFIKPFLEGWTQAALGNLQISNLKDNSVHLYHAILISDYLKHPEGIVALLEETAKTQDLSASDLERIGDIYAHLGKKEKAVEFYSKVLREWPDETSVTLKIKDVEAGKKPQIFQTVQSPKEGLAEAFYDISKILYQESGDESARVFAHMALHLNPKKTEAELMLAYIAARHERYGEAIAHYSSVPSDNQYYVDAQRSIADTQESAGQYDAALNTLQALAKDKDDIEALIKIGDLYRRKEDFKKASESYDRVLARFETTTPEKYWHLHYLRGMCLERMGKWEAAEKDLLTALEFKPDHPYVLNYLGYAWADRDVNLPRALNMIRKATVLRPDDGYITDSLGWVLYRMGNYSAAIPELEKAVALQPYDPIINDHLGDAYWQVGRKLEAKFQWERAKNHTQDIALVKQMDQKLAEGLTTKTQLLGANSQAVDSEKPRTEKK